MTLKGKLKILIVEDSEDDTLLEIHQIKKGGYDIYFERVENALDMSNALEEKEWDIILSDYAMPHFNGLEALSLLKEKGIDLPFIIISGTIGEEVAVEAMRSGASDYIMKDNLRRLLPAIEREIQEAKNRAERKLLEVKKKQAEKSLQESEARYRLIAENTADTITVLDLELNILYVSPSVNKLRGYTIEETMSQSLDQYLTTESFHKVKQVLKEQLASEINGKDNSRSVLLELEQFHKNGSVIQVEVSASFIRDFDLNPISILVVTRDITLRKQAEEQLKVLSHSVEQSPAMIIITDIQGYIEYVNPKFEEVTGYTTSEVIGKNPNIIKSGKMPDRIYNEMWNTIISGNVWSGELINRKKNGDFYWANLSVSPITDNNGNIKHFAGIQEDITVKKKTEEELISAKEHAEESDRLKSAFLANISHEIRTPMNAIVGFSSLLDNPDIQNDEKDGFIKNIVKSSETLMILIDDLVEMSKIQSNQFNIIKKKVDINELLKELYDYFKLKIESENINLSIVGDTNSNSLICIVDPIRLNQVLSNLIGNAIKFTESGFVKYGVFVHEQGYLTFFVEDSGIGIPESVGNSVFERFIKIETSLTKFYDGLGLGLSICYQLVNAMGGSIWYESKLNKGTKFFFTIPYVESQEISKSELLKVETIPLPDLSNKQILIVEDDEPNYWLLVLYLSKSKARITWAKNGIEALEKYRNNNYDLVLMDLKLPVMNGVEASKKIRQIKPEQLIIAQTAFIQKDESINDDECKFDGYLEKPITKNELLETVNNVFKM